MRQTPATEAIALLIDLAQRGEIDPWDVQVIEVIDRYLSSLPWGDDAQMSPRDTDLSQSGQAFLWASMLVLLKADTLQRLEEPDEPEDSDTSSEIDPTNEPRLPLYLERHIRRRTAAPPPKKRPVTLNELIEQLQQMADQLEATPTPIRSTRRQSLSRGQAAQAITQLAHDENLTDIAKRLEQFISGHWHEIAAGKDWLNLEQLLEWWTVSPTVSTNDNRPRAVDTTKPLVSDRVGVFWALLLLSAQSKVELSQEEFYQDLKIRTLG
ncbi:MAG: segregation/condensation protein A [Coleofasciculus sp. D1-CHI-01]|uniref:segregation/condensation protein A n=1 Tax=Coleofasciculus sp. D1-CHI-01 TaxID=3068482 RepID=UPI003302386F